MVANSIHERLRLASPTAPQALGGYDVVGMIGRGGMGAVYAAVDRERGTRVALKTLRDIGAVGVQQLKREFRSVADITHRNVASVYELSAVDGLWFFTMECIDGANLTRWARGPKRFDIGLGTPSSIPLVQSIRSEGDLDATTGSEVGPRTPTTTIPVVDTVFVGETDVDTSPTAMDLTLQDSSPSAQTAVQRNPAYPELANEACVPKVGFEVLRGAIGELVEAVAALHGAGVTHGDIKPSNILVEPNGRVVVVDFGLARNRDENQVGGDGQTAGTPTYMAPEQLGGASEDPMAADWYAVGVVLYELLTGLKPFTAKSIVALFFKKSYELPQSPREILAEVPADLSEICMALLRPAPETRPDGQQLLKVFAGDEAARRQLSERTVRSEFVGRRIELRRLESAYSMAQWGRTISVNAHGPSGIGKSATVRSFLGGVRGIGARVLTGRCYERETLPYKGFDSVLDTLADWVKALPRDEARARMPANTAELGLTFEVMMSIPAWSLGLTAAPGTQEPAEVRRRAFHALGEVIAGFARSSPVVLTIDDLQWADTDSIALLVALLDQLTDAGVGLLSIMTYRPSAYDNRDLDRYFDLEGSRREARHVLELPLAPLSAQDSLAMAETALASLGAEGSTDAELIVSEAQGVPFFIEELARYAADHGLKAGALSLEAMLAARVGRLTAVQRGLLELAAVADRPTTQAVLFSAASLEAAAVPALLALRSASMVTWSGANQDDYVSVYHDRIREWMVGDLSPATTAEHHRALGRAVHDAHREAPAGSWTFDVVRHLDSARADLTSQERLTLTKLAADAGRFARRAGAFPRASQSFEAGLRSLDAASWVENYELALALAVGAAESAYLSDEPDGLAERVALVHQKARTPLDRLTVWEVEIDAAVGKSDYPGAVAIATEALSALGIELPREPTEADVGAAFGEALAALETIGAKGLEGLPEVTNARIKAARRIQIRAAPAAYFAAPLLLPIYACNLIMSSIQEGLSNATPYALGLFGIVLNTLGMHDVSHRWGHVALGLVDRWEDRSLAACTNHVLFNLVTNWRVPLASTLDRALETFELGRETGDLEYAGYSAHAYVLNALYSGSVPLEPLYAKALDLGGQMGALGELNAQHIHAPFEQTLKCLLGKAQDAACLDGATFSAADELALAEANGSQSGAFIIHCVRGLIRTWFGDPVHALESLDAAFSLFDAAPSVWHQPVVRQFRVVATALAWPQLSVSEREQRIEVVDADIEAMRALAVHGPMNFEHKVQLMEAARCLMVEDATPGGPAVTNALALLAGSADLANAGGWHNDVAMAWELAATVSHEPKDARQRARAAYEAWGASEKVRRLS